MKTFYFFILVGLIFQVRPVSGASSELWGRKGEKWRADSRLPFFGFAGYHYGDDSIPDIPVVVSVSDFGAKANDEIGDSVAIQAAINATEKGAILIPPGRFILDKPITIKKSNIVLRGSGKGKTILYVPQSLQELNPLKRNADGGTKLAYSFGGAFLSIEGIRENNTGVPVDKSAKRGDVRLHLAHTKEIKQGMRVQLNIQMNSEFGRHLHADQVDAGEGTMGFPLSTVVQVRSVEKNTILIDRPLRFDVRIEWNPTVSIFTTNVEESGLENFTIQMKGNPKKKHLLEEGFNAIHLISAVNCWVRDIEIIDADLGVKLDNRSRFCQVERIHICTEQRNLSDGPSGHHAVWISGVSQECLISDFWIETEFVHDLTYEGLCHGNVIRRGKGLRLNFDHHRNAPFENLLSDLDVGSPDRLWKSSGATHRGTHSGARTTAWNIRHSGGRINLLKKDHFPQANLIGVQDYPVSKRDDWWIEPLADPMVPPELYEAQLKLRKRDDFGASFLD